MKTEYRRKTQPHYQGIGNTFAVTIAVHNAIPEQRIRRVQSQTKAALQQIDQDDLPDKAGRKKFIHDKYRAYFEQLLHEKRSQEHPFRDAEVAKLLVRRIEQFSAGYFHLEAFSIMSNHAHLLMDFSKQCPNNWDGVSCPPGYRNLAQVIGFIKGGSGYDVNKALGRKGKLWPPGYYDRYIRSMAHFSNEFWYILRNPEKAGLVENWRDHEFTYGAPRLLE